MNRHLRAAALSVVTSLALASVAAAQDPSLPDPEDVTLPQRQFVINLGLGVSAGPRYDGADENLAQPVPLISFSRITLPGVGQFGGPKPRRGIFLFPTFDYIGSRKPGDSSDLKGTEDIDWALAVGLGGGYRYDWWRVFVQADYGFNGYSGFRGQIGADVIAEPAEKVSFSIGPRLAWAGDDYMDTYFSVTGSEAAASGGRLDRYQADGGLRAAGVAANASYAVTDRVFLLFNARYDRLVGDAGDSPIVEAGSANQFTFGAGLSYRLSFDVFE
jgi:outer membrane scaffolding protein for murein synthesis (MipA/OmpV family)